MGGRRSSAGMGGRRGSEVSRASVDKGRRSSKARVLFVLGGVCAHIKDWGRGCLCRVMFRVLIFCFVFLEG